MVILKNGVFPYARPDAVERTMKIYRKKKIKPELLEKNPSDSEFIVRLKYLLSLTGNGRSKNKDWMAMKRLLENDGYWRNKCGPVKNTGKNLGEYLK